MTIPPITINRPMPPQLPQRPEIPRAMFSALAIAAKMMKINAENARSVVGLLDAAQANLQQVTASSNGVGQTLDITV